MKFPSSRPMLLWNARSGTVLRVNRQFIELTGFDQQKLSAQTLLDWIHPDERELLANCLARGKGEVIARHFTAEGEWIKMDWHVRPSPDGCSVLGLLHSDTEGAPAACGETPQTQKSLAETLDAMVRIVEAKNPGKRCSVLLVDSQHEYVTVGAGPSFPEEYNQAVEGLKIGPAVGSCGTAAFWKIPIIVEDISTDPLWKDLREAAAIAGVSSCWSHPVLSKDGQVLGAMALYDNQPIAPTAAEMDALELAARMVGLAVEHHRLEDQLRSASKLEALGVLASGIAHDFNNMLTVVQGNAELALAELPSGDTVRPMLQQIMAATIGATDFCNQMLAYAGRGTLSTETLEFNSLLRDIGSLLQVSLSKKANLIFDLHDGPLEVFADRSQLRQVVMNLITNGAEAIGNNEGRIVLSTTRHRIGPKNSDALYWAAQLEPGAYVRLDVSDTGIGMDPKTQSRIFDPFFTTKNTGRGLGLAAVQGIVLSHGGAIHLESAQGEGTTFTMLLPQSTSSHSRPHVAEIEYNPRQARVLVVDDELEVRKVLSKILRKAGYDVLEAHDGKNAVEIYGRELDSIDLVLLDLNMPGLDGEEVFGELVKIRPDVRVILSSGFTEQEILHRFQGVKPAGFVQKPTLVKELLSRIAQVLEFTAHSDQN